MLGAALNASGGALAGLLGGVAGAAQTARVQPHTKSAEEARLRAHWLWDIGLCTGDVRGRTQDCCTSIVRAGPNLIASSLLDPRKKRHELKDTQHQQHQQWHLTRL